MRVTICLSLLVNLLLVGCSSLSFSVPTPAVRGLPVLEEVMRTEKERVLPSNGEVRHYPEEHNSRVDIQPQKDFQVLPDQSLPCERAEAGIPLDITVPDDSTFLPGERFVKIWKLRNTGSCEWTTDYSVVWFSGASIGLQPSEKLKQAVKPGDEIEVIVEMVSPATPGYYQSNWKLQNPQGDLFGIGPEGQSPFWVRIQVLPQPTNTVDANSVQKISTPVIYLTGNFALLSGDTLDIDEEIHNPDQGTDLAFEIIDENYWIKPGENSFLAFVTSVPPSLEDCRKAEFSETPILIHSEFQGGFLCVQTNSGRIASVFLSINLERGELSGSYIVWKNP